MTNTLRFHLTIWPVVFFTLLLVVFCAFVYSLLARSLMARLDDKLSSQANTAAVLMQDEIQEAAGDTNKAASETVFDMGLGEHAIAVLRDGQPLAGQVPAEFRRAAREVAYGGHTFTIVSGESDESVEASLRLLRRVILLVLPIFIVLVTIGCSVITARNLAPLETMAAQAARISSTNLDRRLEIGDARDELAMLSGSFNELLSRLDQSFDSMRRFVADASHELRTPLSIIRGEADVSLTQERSPAEYRESLAVILDESRRLSRLVDDLLNLARADAGSVKLRITEFYFNDLLGDCCRSVQSLAAARGITIESHAGADIPGDILFRGDEELLRRLVVNLLDNAIRYTPSGGKVTASIASTENGVRLWISDTGIGISPDAAPHVFERFFRADKARSRAEGGAGLGLSIVKWIAESHHGGVELESTPAAGSTFTVTLRNESSSVHV